METHTAPPTAGSNRNQHHCLCQQTGCTKRAHVTTVGERIQLSLRVFEACSLLEWVWASSYVCLRWSRPAERSNISKKLKKQGLHQPNMLKLQILSFKNDTFCQMQIKAIYQNIGTHLQTHTHATTVAVDFTPSCTNTQSRVSETAQGSIGWAGRKSGALTLGRAPASAEKLLWPTYSDTGPSPHTAPYWAAGRWQLGPPFNSVGKREIKQGGEISGLNSSLFGWNLSNQTQQRGKGHFKLLVN